jgi:uncharacterized membrane protein SpoIIM required for sporulation
MSRTRALGIILAVTLISHGVSVLLGYLLGRSRLLSVGWFAKTKHLLSDPLTRRIHAWLDKQKMTSISRGARGRLLLLIFLNNLLHAVSTRTLCGLIFILPYLFAVWAGIAQGVGCSRVKLKYSAIVRAGILEFVGYDLASVAGINLGLSLLSSLIGSSTGPFVSAWRELAYIYPAVGVLLFSGALIETVFVMRKGSSPNKLREMAQQIDMEKLRSALARALESQSDRDQIDMDELRRDLEDGLKNL